MKLTPDYIRDKLLELGFSPAKKGLHYIVDAVMILDDNPDAAYNTVKQVYIPIAVKNDVKFQTVERNIRHAIENAMSHGYDRIHDYLRCQPTATNGSYKNADFLAAFHMALHRE